MALSKQEQARVKELQALIGQNIDTNVAQAARSELATYADKDPGLKKQIVQTLISEHSALTTKLNNPKLVLGEKPGLEGANGGGNGQNPAGMAGGAMLGANIGGRLAGVPGVVVGYMAGGALGMQGGERNYTKENIEKARAEYERKLTSGEWKQDLTKQMNAIEKELENYGVTRDYSTDTTGASKSGVTAGVWKGLPEGVKPEPLRQSANDTKIDTIMSSNVPGTMVDVTNPDGTVSKVYGGNVAQRQNADAQMAAQEKANQRIPYVAPEQIQGMKDQIASLQKNVADTTNMEATSKEIKARNDRMRNEITNLQGMIDKSSQVKGATVGNPQGLPIDPTTGQPMATAGAQDTGAPVYSFELSPDMKLIEDTVRATVEKGAPQLDQNYIQDMGKTIEAATAPQAEAGQVAIQNAANAMSPESYGSGKQLKATRAFITDLTANRMAQSLAMGERKQTQDTGQYNLAMGRLNDIQNYKDAAKLMTTQQERDDYYAALKRKWELEDQQTQIGAANTTQQNAINANKDAAAIARENQLADIARTRTYGLQDYSTLRADSLTDAETQKKYYEDILNKYKQEQPSDFETLLNSFLKGAGTAVGTLGTKAIVGV